jgi:hypothetical protein
VLELLDELETFPIDAAMLKATRIGFILNQKIRVEGSEQVKAKTMRVLKTWQMKTMRVPTVADLKPKGNSDAFNDTPPVSPSVNRQSSETGISLSRSFSSNLANSNVAHAALAGVAVLRTNKGQLKEAEPAVAVATTAVSSIIELKKMQESSHANRFASKLGVPVRDNAAAALYRGLQSVNPTNSI